jgi:hypothetical protein
MPYAKFLVVVQNKKIPNFNPHLGIELFVLAQEVNTEVGESNEVLQLARGRHNHLAHHVLCIGGEEIAQWSRRGVMGVNLGFGDGHSFIFLKINTGSFQAKMPVDFLMGTRASSYSF